MIASPRLRWQRKRLDIDKQRRLRTRGSPYAVTEALGIGKPLDAVSKDAPFGQYFVSIFSEMATAAGQAMGVKFDSLESPSVRMTLDALPPAAASPGTFDPGFYTTMATAINAIPFICKAEPGIFHQPVFTPWRPNPADAS